MVDTLKGYSFLLAGIDTGIRSSLGFVLFEVFLPRGEKLEKLLKIASKKSSKKRDLSLVLIDLLKESQFHKWFWQVYSFSTEAERKGTTEHIYKVISETERACNKKVSLFIEDFLFFNNKTIKSKASWFTVAKLQHTIGYLTGYFTAKGISVKIVKPKTWRSLVGSFHYELAAYLFPEAFSKRNSQADHISSATGIALSGILISKNLLKNR
ncbi:MAG: hypothetical protein QXX12_05435 [Nanopusillaceae archaeon]